ncbi:MAG: aldose 1-epimerase [Alphaproteobacteria bacterium]|nr:aldose 1-epimerase [Alphaproteobacteria bacterium]
MCGRTRRWPICSTRAICPCPGSNWRSSGDRRHRALFHCPRRRALLPYVGISHSGWSARLLPECGGSLASLHLDGAEILRTMPQGSVDPLTSACFPLVPYANRIAGGMFARGETKVRLPRNFPPETSSLHGFGWQAKWEILSASTSECALEHRHPGLGPTPWPDDPTDWPWAYEAQHRVRLGRQGCMIALEVTNRSNSTMPAGLGLHPYFRRRPETRLRFAAEGVMLVDEASIPTGMIAPPDRFGDFARGSALPGETLDHCFAGWNGMATIEDDLGAIALTARGAPHLHLYAPADGSALCLEPVSHVPDALNRTPVCMTVLPPGCTSGLRMWISAHPLD